MAPSDAVETSTDAGTVSVYGQVTFAERQGGDLHLDLYVPETEDPPLVVY
ncbi:alpha/beta hydrolase, partial [Halobacteriales archaeon QH_3_68_24]